MNRIPDSTALRIVSVLFLLGAIMAIIEFAVSFSQNRLVIPWGILGIPIFFGLPAYRRPWRTVAMVLLLIPLIVLPCTGLIALVSGAPKFITLVGIRIAEVPAAVFTLWLAFFWLVSLWEFRVLCRESIRRAFGIPASSRGLSTS